ncbi:unnamed protein product [Prunus armeniaca]
MFSSRFFWVYSEAFYKLQWRVDQRLLQKYKEEEEKRKNSWSKFLGKTFSIPSKNREELKDDQRKPRILMGIERGKESSFWMNRNKVLKSLIKAQKRSWEERSY